MVVWFIFPLILRLTDISKYFRQSLGLLDNESQLYLQMCLIADRLFWDSWDPHNLAEGMFAVANVISFTRLSYVLPANELFGPMQISLAKMISVSRRVRSTFNASYIFGSMQICSRHVSSSHWALNIASDDKTNGDNLEVSILSSIKYCYVDAILMSTNNIQFHD